MKFCFFYPICIVIALLAAFWCFAQRSEWCSRNKTLTACLCSWFVKFFFATWYHCTGIQWIWFCFRCANQRSCNKKKKKNNKKIIANEYDEINYYVLLVGHWTWKILLSHIIAYHKLLDKTTAENNNHNCGSITSIIIRSMFQCWQPVDSIIIPL